MKNKSIIDVQAIFKELDGWPTIKQRGPTISHVDENGIVHVVDRDGITIMMMHRNDWDDLRKWCL